MTKLWEGLLNTTTEAREVAKRVDLEATTRHRQEQAKLIRRGLVCFCGESANKVQQTVQADGVVLRRRKCANGHSIVTQEAICSPEEYNAWQRQQPGINAKKNRSRNRRKQT